MELGRKVGSGIVMGIPMVVGAIGLKDELNSWLAVVIWIAAMIAIYLATITGKFSGSKNKA